MNEAIIFFLGAMSGGIVAAAFLCLLQANRER